MGGRVDEQSPCASTSLLSGLTRLNTPETPVYIIPGDNKVQARLAHATIVYKILKGMSPTEPTTNPDLSEADRQKYLADFKAEVKAAHKK